MSIKLESNRRRFLVDKCPLVCVSCFVIPALKSEVTPFPVDRSVSDFEQAQQLNPRKLCLYVRIKQLIFPMGKCSQSASSPRLHFCLSPLHRALRLASLPSEAQAAKLKSNMWDRVSIFHPPSFKRQPITALSDPANKPCIPSMPIREGFVQAQSAATHALIIV